MSRSTLVLHLTDVVREVELVVLQLLQPTLAHQTLGVDHKDLLPALLHRLSRLDLSQE